MAEPTAINLPSGDQVKRVRRIGPGVMLARVGAGSGVSVRVGGDGGVGVSSINATAAAVGTNWTLGAGAGSVIFAATSAAGRAGVRVAGLLATGLPT